MSPYLYQTAGVSTLRTVQNGPAKTRLARATTSSWMGKRAVNARQVTTIIVLGALASIVVLMLSICVLRLVRRRHSNPKYIPTPFLKRLWSNWRVPSTTTTYHPASDIDDTSTDATSVHQPSRVPVSASVGVGSNVPESGSATQLQGSTTVGSNAAPDRQTSVRSIMTLPPYRINPANTEQVIAREGERDGVDVVVEMPTEEDLEEMRENEMDALYQIRLARRHENAEREERRRQRREARERGDLLALEDIRTRTRAASNNSLIEELRRDHDRLKDQRSRAVSSVSYADLGVARHDGSRIRANSTESERVGLLSDAASIGEISGHRRNRSSSVLSIDSDFPSPSLQSRSRASSRAETARRASAVHTRAGSSPEVVEADVGDLDMPPHSPPRYDDVSLDDEGSRATTPAPVPQNEPPPDYPGPSYTRRDTRSCQSSPGEGDDSEDRGRRMSRHGVNGAPQLPSLRLGALPQIVIDPSTDGPVRI